MTGQTYLLQGLTLPAFHLFINRPKMTYSNLPLSFLILTSISLSTERDKFSRKKSLLGLRCPTPFVWGLGMLRPDYFLLGKLVLLPKDDPWLLFFLFFFPLYPLSLKPFV